MTRNSMSYLAVLRHSIPMPAKHEVVKGAITAVVHGYRDGGSQDDATRARRLAVIRSDLPWIPRRCLSADILTPSLERILEAYLTSEPLLIQLFRYRQRTAPQQPQTCTHRRRHLRQQSTQRHARTTSHQRPRPRRGGQRLGRAIAPTPPPARWATATAP